MVSENDDRRGRQLLRCDMCDYQCIDRRDFTRHLNTQKHKRRILEDLKVANTKNYKCVCGKSYKHSCSLSKHKKVCVKCVRDHISGKNAKSATSSLSLGDETAAEQVITMKKENSELRSLLMMQQKQISKLIPKIGNNNTTNNNVTLNIFLNEHCKDAFNISDFVDTIPTEITQLEYIANYGIVEGISNIFSKAIQYMDITKRPIHCTDSKRDTFYIKDNEVWTKEDRDKKKMNSAIKTIRHHQFGNISKWRKIHPGCEQMDHSKNDILLRMVRENASLDDIKMKKVIKLIAKSVKIPKTVRNVTEIHHTEGGDDFNGEENLEGFEGFEGSGGFGFDSFKCDDNENNES